jgi:phage terminase large subunit-like protein
MSGFKPTPHPVIPTPSSDDIRRLVEKVGAEKTAEILQLREDKIQAEKTDPFRHGYEPWYWQEADKALETYDEMLLSGGNRAGKTEYAAKKVINTLVSKPNSRVWCLHTTNQSSIQMQQSVIWKYLPPELKIAKKTRVTNISYSQKNGFSENSFVLPNGSQCFFMNYAQDRDVIEGGEVDFVWCDELVPLDWVETLRFRIITRSGKMIITFTPITGYTNVVKDYLAGCKILNERPASLLADVQPLPQCRRGHMPFLAKCIRPTACAMWFFSEWNPYNPFENLARGLRGRTPYEIKIRAYGWADSLTGTMFPRFGDANIIPANKIPKEGVRYMAIDPAGARNWFMLWLLIDKEGHYYIYREWPDLSVGEWALPSDKADGKSGTGQTNGAGKGINEYRALIRHLEKEDGASPVERYIDPRAGNSQAIGAKGGTSIIDLFSDGTEEEAMYLTPAAGISIDEGVAIINDWLGYDKTRPIDALNQPKLFVSWDCENLIFALKEWTGADGQKGACKDPIDTLRYLAVMNPTYEDEKTFKSTKPYAY